MARVKMTVLKKLDGIVNAQKYAREAARTALHDVADDLVRASSGAAPKDKGILEKSWHKAVKGSGTKMYAEVGYSVKEGGYDYAVRMHEDTYNLGPGSRAKPGGAGMSGKTYPVGNKFLTRPLKGEASTYRDHIADAIRKAMGGR
jgi:hypothetical protein